MSWERQKGSSCESKYFCTLSLGFTCGKFVREGVWEWTETPDNCNSSLMTLAFANAIAASSYKRSASSLAFSLLLRLAMALYSSSISCALAFSRVDVTEFIDPLVELLIACASNNKLFICQLLSFITLSENSLRLAAVSSNHFRSPTISLDFTQAVNSCTDKSVNR